MIQKISGPISTWRIFDNERRYTVITLPFSQASELIMAVRYNAIQEIGEQRDVDDRHVKKIMDEMKHGRFTPTSISSNLSDLHIKNLNISKGKMSLEVDSDSPLRQTDGGHRYEALFRLRKQLEDSLLKADEAEKENIVRFVKQINECPITSVVYLDGDPQQDFVNLQAGRKVDASHMFSLKTQRANDPIAQMAKEIAVNLNKNPESPFLNSIKFDSRGIAPLGISTLCSRGSSDLSTSLIGLAKLSQISNQNKNLEHFTNAIINCYKVINKDCPELIESGKILTPIKNCGTKGSATMMIGLGICLQYRLLKVKHEVATKSDMQAVLDAAIETLNKPVNGNFSGPVKRKLIGDFAAVFFADMECEKHFDIPKELLEILSTSCFSVPVIEKEKKKRGRKPKSATVPVPPLETQAEDETALDDETVLVEG